jgi:hypothetical protein
MVTADQLTDGQSSRTGTSTVRERPVLTYCVEKVERQRFREASDIQPLCDRSIVAVLVSLGR